MPNSTHTKWVYFAKAGGSLKERSFTVREYVEMCQQAGVPFSDSRLYNAIRERVIQHTEAKAPHTKLRVFYVDFVKWRGYDPLEMIRVNENARHLDGKMACPACAEAMRAFWRFCPMCGRANKFAEHFEKEEFTDIDSFANDLQMTG